MHPFLDKWLSRWFWGKGKELTTAQKYILALGANLSEQNSYPYDQLHTRYPMETMKQLLVDFWGVHNASHLKTTLRTLKEKGHRSYFQQAYSRLCRNPSGPLPEDVQVFLMKRFANQSMVYEFMQQNQHRITKNSLLGWDLCRYINNCRAGFVAGYLSEKEAWLQLLPIAKVLQLAYTSFEQLSDDYMLGWSFWRGGLTPLVSVAFAADWLQTHPESPWKQLAWDTRLPLFLIR